MDILFPEGEAPYVVGTMTRALFIPRVDIGPTVAVHFRPGGAYPLMPLPMQELTDDRVDLKDVWRRATSGESVQAHLSSEFRALTGWTPRQYAKSPGRRGSIFPRPETIRPIECHHG